MSEERAHTSARQAGLSPTDLRIIDKLRKTIIEKNNPKNNSKESAKSIDWRTVINESLDKTKKSSTTVIE